MTCLEKLRIEHPELLSDQYTGCTGCPHGYGYAKIPNYCCDINTIEQNCEKCWNREVEECEEQEMTREEKIKKIESICEKCRTTNRWNCDICIYGNFRKCNDEELDQMVNYAE